jgi:hypothetical protein
MYADDVRKMLTATERKVLIRLSTPRKIQDYLDALPINFEIRGATYLSPRRVLHDKVAHCFEASLLAATALALHGEPPLLLDLRAIAGEDDHAVALFRVNGRWGAISKTNHSVLRWRDAIYETPRELAASYFHEYTSEDGRKVLREYSSPFDLRRFDPKRWVVAEDNLDWLAEALDKSRHFPLLPKKNMRHLRKASKIELKTSDIREWKRVRNSIVRASN